VNLRKDHCRNLHSRTTRELVTTDGGRGAFVAPSPPLRAGTSRLLPANRTPARNAPRKSNQESHAGGPGHGAPPASASYELFKTTLGNGYLGSRIDEERSEMRYLV
jgi:hypothetical protein